METISRSLLTFLLNAIWQVPLVAGLAALICRQARRAPGSHKHLVWVAALAGCLILPLASLRKVEPARESVQLPQVAAQNFVTAPGQGAAALQKSAARTAKPARSVSIAETTARLVFAAYVIFLLVWGVRLGRAYFRTARLCRNSRRVDPFGDLAAVWDRAASAFRLSAVELRISETVSGPVTAGIRKAVIILPESLFAAAPEEVLLTAVGHEMAHIVRRDFGCNLLYELLLAPLSFHPAVSLIRRGIERTREMACDDLVAGCLLEPRAYARSVMSIAAAMPAQARSGYTLGVFDGDILEERIRRLIEFRGADRKRAPILLAAGLSALVVCVAIGSTLAISARAQSAATPELKLGVEAYNRGDYQNAAAHFRQAAALDPNNLNASLDLATALQRLSATDSRAGNAPQQEAAQQYREVLARDPANRNAIFGLAAVNGAQGANESRDLLLKLLGRDPQNADAYYTAGVVDWLLAFGPIMAAQKTAGVWPAEVFVPDVAVRAGLRAKYLPNVEEGFRMLQIALDKNPGSSDAMAYMNLLLRAKAAMASSAEESRALTQQADNWVSKALAARRIEGQRPPAPAMLDADAPPPLAIPAPPPPPPPPPCAPNCVGNPKERGGLPPAPPPPPAAGERGGLPPAPPPPPAAAGERGGLPPAPPPPPAPPRN